MKTIIAGTRTATHFNFAAAMRRCPFVDDISEVVSGGAKGADFEGEEWALFYHIPIIRFLPDWLTHGRAAGPIRNAAMADYADALILVWDGKSRGSRDMLQKAKAKGLRCFVWDYVKGCEVTA